MSEENIFYEVIVTTSICVYKSVPMELTQQEKLMGFKSSRDVCISQPSKTTHRVIKTRDYSVQKMVYDSVSDNQASTVYTESGEEP